MHLVYNLSRLHKREHLDLFMPIEVGKDCVLRVGTSSRFGQRKKIAREKANLANTVGA